MSLIHKLDLPASSVDLMTRATLAYVVKCRANLKAAHDMELAPEAIGEWRAKLAAALRVHRKVLQLRTEFDLEPGFVLQVTMTPAALCN